MYVIIIMVFNLIEIQLVAESIQLVGYLELSPYKIMEHIMSNEDLLKSFQVISELENRKITYEKAISKVEQEIENAGMW